MKKVAFQIILLGLLLLCSACSQEIFYPTAKITLLVVDADTGEPIEGAKAGISFNQSGFWEPKRKHVGKTTNSQGKATIRGKTLENISIGARKDGYYHTIKNYNLSNRKNINQQRHKPWNPTVTIHLRKIGNPTPMYARQIYWKSFPKDNVNVGFDLIEADWVSPYGKGKVSDIIFRISKDYKNDNEYLVDLNLTFSNEYDGIYPYPEAQLVFSELVLPAIAPLEGYHNKLDKFKGRNLEDNWIGDVSDRQHYYFRVRSVVKDGKLLKAMYGKIYRDIDFNARCYAGVGCSDDPKIRFIYFLNPDWTRNVEFDYNKNLFQDSDARHVRLIMP